MRDNKLFEARAIIMEYHFASDNVHNDENLTSYSVSLKFYDELIGKLKNIAFIPEHEISDTFFTFNIPYK